MGKYENDTRKAAIDLEGYLTKDEILPLHIIVRTFMKRYGFKKRTVLTMIADAYPEFTVNEETGVITRLP